MALYNWRCDKCEGVTEVVRSFADIDNPPEACEDCGNPSFHPERVQVRTPGVKQFILVDGGVGWPGHGFYNKNPNDWRTK